MSSLQSIHAWFKPRAPEYDDVMFYCFVQFHLTHQLDRALSRGRAHGVAFKGDLPIGVGRGSVEAWTEPILFHLDRQTGSPPDSFAVLGQNWGFPTYDWPSMARDGYAWWRRRFERMSTYFDALRIDHILGFFRIWEIPGHCAEGLLGHFNPARPLRPEEIRAFGFEHDPARFTVPVATDESLSQLFAVHRARLTELLLYTPATDESVWTYDYNTNTWQEFQHKNDGPNVRDYTMLAYDEKADKIIMYGGYDYGNDETWIYDLNTDTWRQMLRITNPGIISRYGMVYVKDVNRTILFGGQDGPNQFQYMGGTWSYNIKANR